MKHFDSNVEYIKYLVNKEIASRFFQGTLTEHEDSYQDIAKSIIPGPKAQFRCCIYKERHIIEDRVGLALKPTKDDRVINVLDSACDECPIDRFVVTEACRGCLSHKCQEVCPKHAITIVNHRSYINQEICIECGRCKEVCPFNAISEVKRPGVRACPVKAVSMDDNRKSKIDHNKCVSCGSCVYQCPFGAIVDKTYIKDALTLIKESWNNTNYKVFAVIAPAIASQFPEHKLGQVFTAIKNLGFYDIAEASLGADMVSLYEAKEFAETIEEKGWKTSSCCPAFVDFVKRHYPQLMSHVSTAVSPMIAVSRMIKYQHSDAKIVFIGPCTAKKVEIKQNDIKDAIDIVLTFEELQSVLDAKNINIAELEEMSLENTQYCTSSYYGRVFGRTGGVTEGVIQAKEVQNIDVEIKPVRCNGLDECAKALRLAAAGKLNGNFIEGMACKNGCTGGAASMCHAVKGINDVTQYGKTATSSNSLEALNGFDLSLINMERDFDNA